jgi:hypothetical protein
VLPSRCELLLVRSPKNLKIFSGKISSSAAAIAHRRPRDVAGLSMVGGGRAFSTSTSMTPAGTYLASRDLIASELGGGAGL